MAGPADFYEIELTDRHEALARERYAQMGERALAGEHGWAGFAAELALIDAVAAGEAREAPTLAYDVELVHHGKTTAAEVKTRVAVEGWTDPTRFKWLVVPTHHGREPIKEAAELVFFCWVALEARRCWVLGYLRGPDEFRRRAVHYREHEPLPRGGWAGPGGEYAIEINQLRPLPRGLLKELTQ